MTTRTSLVIATLVVGCGGKKDDPPNREDPSKPAITATGGRAKQPIPAEALKGSVRLVNLLVGTDGKTQSVDVWAVGGSPEATKLASNIAFGKASDWFGSPIGVGMHLIVVPTGAPGDDAKKLASMSIGRKDAHETSILQREGDRVATVIPGAADDLAKPAAGKGLVLLHAGQLMAFDKQLAASPLGGRSFMVKEPGGTCAETVLGGTNSTTHTVDAGKAKFTLHKWPGRCDTPELHALEVDVAADKGVRIEVFTNDGKSLDHATMPITLK